MHWLVMLGLLGAGCGGDSSTPTTSSNPGSNPPPSATAVVGSCDQRTGNPSQPYCQEYTAPADLVAVYKSVCTGTWSDAACPRQGTIGGCTSASGQSMGLTLTNWFFPTAGS